MLRGLMARRGYICKDFDASMFRYFLKKTNKSGNPVILSDLLEG